MNKVFRFLYSKLTAAVALCAISIFYFLAEQPEISQTERDDLAGQFRFRQFELPNDNIFPKRTVREVAPSLRDISAWISSTGAGIALNDLNGDGKPNEFCKVDPRTDRVLIGQVPVPEEDALLTAFEPFTLDAGNLANQPAIAPMGCVPNDYNEDGLTDVMVYYWGRSPIIFLARKQKDQLFLNAETYTPQETVKGGERWFTGAATVADVDGDGHLDIIIGNYFQDGAEILDADSQMQQSMQHSMSRAFNGGQSRILRWMGATGGANPAVNFEEIKDYVEAGNAEEKSDLTHGWTLAIAACDLDGDLLPELYFANDFGKDRLLYNRSQPGVIRFSPLVGEKGFTTPNSKVVGHDSFKGMGVDFADLNGDGLFDFYVSNIAAEYALEESHLLFVSTGETNLMKKGIAPYVDRSESLGVSRSSWGWDVKIGDFNNDGEDEIVQATGFIKGGTPRWAELHEVAMGNDQLLSNPQAWHKFQSGDDLSGKTHNRFFVRSRSGRFYDLAAQFGLDRQQITRGIATADVNGDGRLDFAIANQWDDSFFYLNESEQSGDYLGLRLRLPLQAGQKTTISDEPLDILSRPAIGAWVSVALPNGKRLVSFVDGGNGHSGKRSNDVQFGLGNLPPNTRLPIEIRWRDGAGQIRYKKMEINSGWHTILLGED